MSRPSRTYYEYALAYLIPACVVLAAFAYCRVYPFGDTSVFVWDLNIQYAGFFGWLSETLRNGGSLGYSAAKGLGGSMIALFAYYLSSPFNVLAIFFDPAHTPQLLSWLTLLKLPSAGLTCYVFLRHRYSPGFKYVLLASAYATCAYALGYCSNIMWLDGVIMLPLVALGVQRAVRSRTYGVLLATTAAAIYFNWYSAYMVCLFSILFFIFEIVASYNFSVRGHIGALARAAGRYALCMVLALGVAAALFLPAALGLVKGKGGGFDLSLFLSPGFQVNPLDLFSYFTIGSNVGAEISAPPLFVSGMVLVCAGAFFLDKRVDKRRRVAYGAILAILALSFCYFTFGDIWTGFIRSSSYNHRQAFVGIFMLVMVAAEELYRSRNRGTPGRRPREDNVVRAEAGRTAGSDDAGTGSMHPQGGSVESGAVTAEKPERRRAPLGSTLGGRLLKAALMLDLLILASSFNVWFRVGHIEPSSMLLAIEVAALPLFALALGRACAHRSLAVQRAGLVLLVCLFMAEQGYSAVLLFSKYDQKASTYESYIEKMQTAYDALESNNAFNRVGQAGFTYLGAHTSVCTDESLIYGASNLSHYSSTMRESSELLSSRLGYCKPSIFGVYYNSPLLVPDALLGVRYTLDDVAPPSSKLMEGITLPYAGFAAYENTRALPMGYGVSDAAKTPVDWSDDPFDNQEAMLGSMTGEDAESLYTREKPVALTPVGPDAPWADGLTWSITVSHAGPVYLYTPIVNTTATNEGGIVTEVRVNGALVQTVGTRFGANVVYAGEYHTGDVLNVTLTPRDPGQTFADERGNPVTAGEVYAQSDDPRFLMVETLNLNEFDRLVSALDTKGFSAKAVRDGSVDATFQAAGDETLLISIPYADGWQATVNGKPQRIHRLYGGLMGLDVDKGANDIEMRFVPPGLRAGIVITVLSSGAAICIALLRRRKRPSCKPAASEDHRRGPSAFPYAPPSGSARGLRSKR